MGTFLVSHTFDNFETFSIVVDTWDLDFIQLTPGSFCADLFLFGDQEFQITEVCYNKLLHQRGSAPPNCYTFAVHHQTSAPIRWRYLDVPSNSIIVFPENNELQGLSQPGHHVFTWTVTEGYLAIVASEIGLPEPGQFIKKGMVTLCDPIRIIKIRRFLELLCSTMKKTSGAFVEDVLTYENKWKIARLYLLALASSTNIKPKKKRVSRNRIVNRIFEYVDSDLSTPRNIPELCHITEVDERTLRNIFYDLFSTSPSKYLKCYRLNRVRKAIVALDSPQAKIADIANLNGFWHIGQFAADYRRLFGELPSETLSKYK
jgi:AraC family transcriptional regulator, ethanolamine operon transcriptional activator